MTRKYKILAKYIKDMSSETPDVETYISAGNNMTKYQLDIDIKSIALKNKMIEINITLKFQHKDTQVKRSHFEIVYAVAVKVDETIKEKKDLEKIDNEIVDTLLLARNKFPGSQISLDALCKRYRIDNSKRVQHTALIDCDLLAKVYINLIDQKEPTLDFKNKEEEVSKLNTGKVIYSTKIIKPSPEELKNHQIYLKTSLKKNFY